MLYYIIILYIILYYIVLYCIILYGQVKVPISSPFCFLWDVPQLFFLVFGGFEDLSPPSDGDDSTDTQSNIALEQLHFSVEHLLSAKVDDQIVNLHFSHLEVS